MNLSELKKAAIVLENASLLVIRGGSDKNKNSELSDDDLNKAALGGLNGEE